MQRLIIKDFIKRKNFVSSEYVLIILKTLSYNTFLDIYTKMIVKNILTTYGFSNTKTLIHNRCIVTGRGRSVLRKYKISRIKFRNFVYEGLLTGYIKV
jgi:small subunit ribosomal protein S14